MGASQKSDDNTAARPAKSSTLIIIGTMADTTWRMFVPVIGFLILGLSLDKKLAITPWLTIIGLAVGVIIAALLVTHQLKKVNR